MLLKRWIEKWQLHALGRLASEFHAHRYRMGAVFGLGLVIAAIQPAAVRLSQRIIDSLQQELAPAMIRWIPFVLIGLFAVSGLAKYFHNTLRRQLTEQIILKLRAALFRKYLMLPLRVIDRRRTGDMLSSIQNDLAQVAAGIDTFCYLLKEPFTFFGLLAVAFYCDWRLSLSTLVVAPVVAYLFSRSGSAVKRYSVRSLSQFSDLMSLSQESIVGARVIKVFTLEQTLLEKFRVIHDEYFKTVYKSIKVQELATPMVEFIGALLMAGVVVYGGYRIQSGELTTGALLGFILSLGLSQMPLKQLNNAFLKIRAAEAAAEKVYALLDTPDLDSLRSGTIRKHDFIGEVRYDQVGLKYEDKAALDGVNLVVHPGECVAFVGHSGSGKTSLVNLLPRLYEVTHGRITIDGIDIREILLNDLRGLVSFVTQDTFLFHDTIYENIRYGNALASATQVECAARQAHCLDFIRSSSHGFDTVIGDRGVCLSGGERQRIAIARAILKAAPILVLDEATSSLDSHSERMVQSALDELMFGRTTFLVAHRFSTVRRATRIYVLDSGNIREVGSHEELLGRRGIYSGLYESQAAMGITI